MNEWKTDRCMKQGSFLTFTLLLLVLGGCTGSSEKGQTPPEGMVYFEGGEITIGTNRGAPNEAPAHNTEVSSFYLDKHPVTVARFRKFVEATGYVTDAERFGNSGVFDVVGQRWKLVDGADWERPLGEEGPKAKDNHPVTQVSWNDAVAYCEWAGRRLPTEAEWEYAAKNGEDSRGRFPWGDTFKPEGEYKANIWQGRFPDSSKVEDGFFYTSPVGYYGETDAGLTDMSGNVWEWTGSTFELYPGNELVRYEYSPDNKAIRGGSFQCDSTFCFGFRVTARMFNSRETGLFHTGFRTAKSSEGKLLGLF